MKTFTLKFLVIFSVGLVSAQQTIDFDTHGASL